MAVDVANHTVMVIRRGRVTEVVGRPGHLSLADAQLVAAAAGGELVAMRLNRKRIDGSIELVRVEQGADGALSV